MAVATINDVMIEVRNLTLDFPGHRRRASNGASMPHGAKSQRRIATTSDGKIRVLDKISFTARPGDRIGLIGKNGAGKSTLLRTLAGIYRPSSGANRVYGRISTLFSSNLGFNGDATGYENIHLSGRLLGLSGKAISDLMPDIVDFCELGDFLDLPLRTYSNGMRLRLGFAIATSIQPEVLLVDEVFGAGDREFREKANQRVKTVMAKASLLMLASHADNIIRTICTKVMWLEQGQIREFGPVDAVLDRYNAATSSSKAARKAEAVCAK